MSFPMMMALRWGTTGALVRYLPTDDRVQGHGLITAVNNVNKRWLSVRTDHQGTVSDGVSRPMRAC